VLSINWNNLLFRSQCYGRRHVLRYYISIACACTILFVTEYGLSIIGCMSQRARLEWHMVWWYIHHSFLVSAVTGQNCHRHCDEWRHSIGSYTVARNHVHQFVQLTHFKLQNFGKGILFVGLLHVFCTSVSAQNIFELSQYHFCLDVFALTSFCCLKVAFVYL
jgi:hypothetical protein